MFAVATGQFYQHFKYWLGAGLAAAAIILPWHVAQVWLHGQTFLHDYVMVNLAGRVVALVHQEPRGPLFYFEILRDGFGVFGILWPLAYIWAIWTIGTKDSGQKLLLLLWITVPLFLFSLATTKLGWYMIFIYPAIAILLGRTTVELCGARTAIAGLAAVMAVWYFRAPVAVEGNPEIKHFLRTVNEIVPSHQPLYLYADRPCEPTGGLTEYRTRAAQRMVPAIVFYSDRRIECATPDVSPSAGAEPKYFVVDTRWHDLPPQLESPVHREGPYVLATLTPAAVSASH
jgi:hypothetical protein